MRNIIKIIEKNGTIVLHHPLSVEDTEVEVEVEVKVVVVVVVVSVVVVVDVGVVVSMVVVGFMIGQLLFPRNEINKSSPM